PHSLPNPVIFINKALAIGHIQMFMYLGKVDFCRVFALGHYLLSLDTEKKCSDNSLEVAYTRLGGVVADEVPQNLAFLIGVEKNFILTDQVTLPDAMDQELSGNGYFLIHTVSVQINDLAAVEDRSRNRVDRVGGKYEMAVRQIYIHGALGVLVMEKVVLFRVEYLQQGRDCELFRLVSL